MESIFGLDVSEKKLDIAVLVNDKLVKQFEISNDLSGFEVLGKELNSVQNPLIILNRFESYSRRTENYLQQNEYQYTMIDPANSEEKMTGLSAIDLAKLMSENHYQPTDPKYSQLCDLEDFHENLLDDLNHQKKSLHEWVSGVFPEIESFSDRLEEKLYWRMVKLYPSPKSVLKYNAPFIEKVLVKIDKKMDKTLKDTEAHDISQELFELAREAPKRHYTDVRIKAIKVTTENLLDIKKEEELISTEMAKISESMK